jgi:hypothetical protein
MSVRRRLWIGVLALILLSTVVAAPTGNALPDPCEACGATCIKEYKSGWDDCYGSPGGCWRTTVC